MMIRYAAVAVTGLNDSSKLLKRADEDPLRWDSFADAKARVAARAAILQDYLDSSGCEYRIRCESGDHHYEVSFVYGPRSLESALPFKTVFHVSTCLLKRGQTQEIER